MLSLRRASVAPLLLCLIALAGDALAPAAAPAATTPDPSVAGPLTVNRVDYDAGPTLVGGEGATYPQELEGSVHLPIGIDKPLPVIVFLHGRHSSCSYGLAGDGTESLGYPCYDTPLTASVDSYKGYDYIAQNLASHGYVVMSIDANGINTYDTANLDSGALARSEIIAQSLDLLAAWNTDDGPGSVSTNLKGKVDLTRIGLMGHSRGGEGVTAFIDYNRTRPATFDPTVGPDFGPRYPGLKAVFALAPIDAADQAPTGVAFAELLPYCDGDVTTLAGAEAFERTKYAAANAAFPRVQYGVNGADHNFFNTIWVDDDQGSTTDQACGPSVTGNVRLSKDEQKAIGNLYMPAFLRRYVGPEPALDPWVTGAATIPPAACPSKLPCDEAVQTSYIAPLAERRTILKPGTTTPTAIGEDGATVTSSGLETYAACTAVEAGTGCPGGGAPATTNRTMAPQLTLRWNGPATWTLNLAPGQADVSGFETLSLRAAANYGDAAHNPVGSSQDFTVTLVGTDGARSSVSAKAYARGALVQDRGSTAAREVVLGGIRIPLTAFSGVDLTHVASIVLGFGDRTPAGSIQLADVAFQEPRTAAQAPTDPTTTSPTDPATPATTQTTPPPTTTAPTATTSTDPAPSTTTQTTTTAPGTTTSTDPASPTTITQTATDPGSPGTATPAPPDVPPATGVPAAAAFSSGIDEQQVYSVAHRGLLVRVRCGGACTVRYTVSISAYGARVAGLRSRKLATLTRTLPAGGRLVTRLRLPGAAARALARLDATTLTVRATTTTGGRAYSAVHRVHVG